MVIGGRETLVAPVVLAVHPMWTDQSRQLIIRLLSPYRSPKHGSQIELPC